MIIRKEENSTETAYSSYSSFKIKKNFFFVCADVQTF